MMGTSREQANSYDVLPCDRVVTIPQYIGTCWFNALLTTVFYSEAARDVVIAAQDTEWERLRRSPNAYMRRVIGYFEHMLRLYKRPEDAGAYRFYDKITPERILYYLHKADPKNMEYDAVTKIRGKYVVRNGMSAGYKVYMYALKLLNFLQIPTVSFTAVALNKEDKYGPFRLALGDIHSRSKVNFARHKQKKSDAYSYSAKSRGYVRSLVYSDPAMLVVDIGYGDKWKSKSVDKKARPDYYFLPGSHENLPQFIRLGNSTYVLDSCTFSSNNGGESVRTSNGKVVKITGGHAIAGVTCNRRRFIYSGWMKKTVDSARGNANENRGDGGLGATKRPCPLMPFDWTQNPRNFYITAKACQVQFSPPNPTSKRFNAFRGPRTYLYVRRNLVHYKKHAIQRLGNAARSGDKARVARLGFSVAKQAVADALRRKARIDRARRPVLARRA
jgi:hypothetical protein